MPAELFRRVDLDALYPPFLERVLDLAADARARGINYYATSGFRSPTEQAALYFQGRTKPGKIVTNARAFYSAHNYGIALDFARDGDADRTGLQATWDRAEYEELGRLAPRYELVWGGDWNGDGKRDRNDWDAAHVQVPGFVTAGELEALKTAGGAYQANESPAFLRRVWSYLDSEIH